MSETPDRPPIALPEDTRLREEYQIGPVLGTGSFGITYQALDKHLDTTVAIKEYYPRQIAGRTAGSNSSTSNEDSEDSLEVHPHTSQDTEEFKRGLQRFMEEGRTIARFDHPNVVDVKSYFEQHGTGYLVMDYYEGQSLAEELAERGGRLPENEALGYANDILSGLEAVHAEGVLHRDIDPQNIYLSYEETSSHSPKAVLIDFGAAREAIGQQSQELEVILKPGYAPPEQYHRSGDFGPHTDIYGCAATLYRCLTGLKPPESTERTTSDELVPPREIREKLSLETDLAVRKGLALRPEQRPASAQEFAHLLGCTETTDRSHQAPASSKTEVPSPRRSSDTDSPIQAAHDASDNSSDPREKALSAPTAGAATGPTESRATDYDPPVGTPDGKRSAAAEEVPAWNLLGLAAALAVPVLGALAFGKAGLGQVFAYFGTWTLVCGGLVGLFRQGERLMTPESRAATADWILQEQFSETASGWPGAFTDLFDAVFTKDHLSWTCFQRSALASFAAVSLLGMSFVGLGLLDPPRSGSELLPAFLLLASVNVFVDYASLFETRWILGHMGNTNRTSAHTGYLAADLVLTILCIVLPVSLFQIISSGVLAGSSILSFRFWEQLVAYVLLFGEWFVQLSGRQGSEAPAVLSVMLFSTLFTSVWVWLYVGSGLLLRALRPLLEGLEWLKRVLDVENKPAEAMGFLLATVASVGFALSAPFAL
ncbi:hypothetical protein BSZ35_18515 [Salinibacter sp. 10B]|uniref:serine/threonine protein kinase n=1 Tax=Salinibacter sp. 10B TaxID=1923971 RepID=UPI000CF50C95|nr:serine/threonine-protein kinase [Salinibacter sp. 10B]PQJ26920.1 hypothetical protein BSZ35_18515 [Salinibacter sp. 10B]